MNSFAALQDIRVLDLSSNLPGPFLTRILSDLGAEVIKLEAPHGEGLRHMPPHVDGMGISFGGLNAGKEAIAVNLKAPEGLALVRAMIPHCDIVVEAFRPGKLAGLGLGYEVLQELNPQVILCSMSGYGQTGSMAAAAGHDINYLAHAGLLGLFAGPDGAPIVPGVQVADVGGGSLPAAIGVLAALLERAQTGRGRHLDIALARGAAAFGAIAYTAALSGATEAPGTGLLDGGAPCYRCYEAADGRYLALGALEPRFFARFCELAGRPELGAKGFRWGEAAAETIASLKTLFKERTAAQWLALCEGHDVCLSLVRSPAEAMADPSLDQAIDSVGGFPVVTAHVGAPPPPRERGPSQLGADAPAVAERLGIPPEILAAAIESGALRWPSKEPQ
jgi:alpha-methylacyl-CoA racemase